jgi:hypothetical protein
MGCWKKGHIKEHQKEKKHCFGKQQKKKKKKKKKKTYRVGLTYNMCSYGF